MGYRSEVGYVIQFEPDIKWADSVTDEQKDITGKDLFNIFLNDAKNNPLTKLAFDEADDDFSLDEDKLRIKFYADHAKWYESFDDVACHEKLLELVDEYIDAQENNEKFRKVSISYGFVRIGEETEDIDSRYGGYDGYDLIYPTRGIEFGS
jgi:hypothetical protein